MKTQFQKTNLIYLIIIIGLLSIFHGSCKKDSTTSPNNNIIIGTIKDIDGNAYDTIRIGTQTWMKQNLKVTHYRNGDSIPNITDPTQWYNCVAGAYCNYNNDSSIALIYGSLYNWFAVIDSRNIAPIGWHVPSNAEWTILTNYIGGDSIAGGKLKEVGTTHWMNPNTGATNLFSFTALPAGYRMSGGYYDLIYGYAAWWSTTPKFNLNDHVWLRSIFYTDIKITSLGNYKSSGYSVRCVKD